MNRLTSLAYLAYFEFAVQYRKTLLGPVWVLLGPALFISTLGLLFQEVTGTSSEQFIPHLATGLVTWTLVQGFVIGSTTVFQRHRAEILQGAMSLLDIIVIDIMRTSLLFVHQALILVVVFYIYDITWSFYSLVSLFGLVLLLVNGLWLTVFFGIVGARYRDLVEIVTAVMRIAFLATPIIWIPAERGAGGIMGAFLTYNPFYHFLDVVRAPLLGHEISDLTWAVVAGFTICGSLLGYQFYASLHRRVPLWL